MATVLAAVLFVSAIVYTGYNYEIYDEFVTLKINNPLMIIAFLLAGIGFLTGMSFLYDKLIKKAPRAVVLGVFMIVGFAVAVLYARTTATRAQADALCLATVASEINSGTAGVYAYDSYIGVYSHQLGFVTILRILFRIFGDMNYKAVQTVMAFLVPIIMISGSGFIRILMKDNRELSGKCEFIYLVLSLINIPVYMYVIYVYGDIAYTALSVLGAWILLSALDSFNVFKAVLFGLVCALDYLCKSNSLIVFVAFFVVLVISLLERGKRKASVILLVSMIFFLLIIPKLNDRAYKAYMPGTDSMPSIAWVGMGMNDDYGRAGWNNFYNQIAFAEAGYDAEATGERVKADIRATVGVWAHNPGYMLDFLNRKMNLQWNTPLYQGLVMNNSFDADKQTSLGAFVYGSSGVQLFLQYFMKVFQITMYAVMFFGLLFFGTHRKSIADYVLLIAVFGGFLFSMIWEAKTRYIFPYLVMLVPYFAVFAVLLIDRFRNKFFKKKVKGEKRKKISVLLISLFMLAFNDGSAYAEFYDCGATPMYYYATVTAEDGLVAEDGTRFEKGETVVVCEEPKSCFAIMKDDKFYSVDVTGREQLAAIEPDPEKGFGEYAPYDETGEYAPYSSEIYYYALKDTYLTTGPGSLFDVACNIARGTRLRELPDSFNNFIRMADEQQDTGWGYISMSEESFGIVFDSEGHICEDCVARNVNDPKIELEVKAGETVLVQARSVGPWPTYYFEHDGQMYGMAGENVMFETEVSAVENIASSDNGEKSKVYVGVGIAAGAVIVVIIGIVLLNKGKKKNKDLGD